MIFKLKNIFVFPSLLLLFILPNIVNSACTGRMYNPISDTNWKTNAFPFTIAMVNLGSGVNPPMMTMPPICVCPSHIPPFISVPGVGMTYWEPLYLTESTRANGCLHTMGGIPLGLGGAARGGGATAVASERSTDALHVHWMTYPVFAILKLFSNGVCMSGSGVFDVGFMSELDPVGLDDLWTNILNPEVFIFANPIAQAACVVDAIAATVSFPLEPLFWCRGAQGSIYPLSYNVNSSTSSQQANILAMDKHLSRWARVGNLRTTIGPSAQCFSHPSPFVPKGQFRKDIVWPIPSNTQPVYGGEVEAIWSYLPPSNLPTKENAGYMLFNGIQCCLRM